MTVLRRRFWIELGLGVGSVVMLLLAAAWPEWIERVFGIDPDGGNGSLEWAIVVVLAVCAITLPLHVRAEWRRVRDDRGAAEESS